VTPFTNFLVSRVSNWLQVSESFRNQSLYRSLYIDLYVSSGRAKLKKWDGIHLHYINRQHYLFVCCWCCVVGLELLTCLDFALTAFPFRSPSSGPNMFSAARMSCFTIGQKIIFHHCQEFLRIGHRIVFHIFRDSIALETCHLEYPSLFPLTMLRVVSFSICVFFNLFMCK